MGESCKTKVATLFLCSLLSLAALACSGGSDSGSPDGNTGGTDNPGGSGGGDGGSGGDGGTGGTGGVNPNLPRIDAVEPNHGTVGTRVTITGANFATSASRVRVYFGSIESAALSAAADGTRVETAVPTGARSGKVVLLTDEVRVEGPEFTVDPNPAPHLLSLDPARVPARRETLVRLVGNGFLRESKVRIDGGAVSASYVSGTELQVTLPSSAVATGGRKNVQVITEPPGGGESEVLTLEVYETLDLIGARATDATTVRLTFDTAVNATQAANASLYTFTDGLTATSARVDPENGARVLVHTTNQAQSNRYRVTVSTALRSAGGGVLQNNQAQFWGYRDLPIPAFTLGNGSGCNSSTLSNPSGVSLYDDGYFVVERTGHQVQTISRQNGELRSFFGHDGASSGVFQEGHDALGCPNDVGSSQAGAFSGPMGQVVLLGDGSRLVGDTGNDRILLWGADNTYRAEFGGRVEGPVLLGELQGQLWVAGGDDVIRILRFDDGGVETSFGGPGQGLGEFAFGIGSHVAPMAVEWGEDIVITDPLNHRLLRFGGPDLPESWLGGGTLSWPDATVPAPEACCDAGTGPGFFTRPRGVVVWLDDLWVIDEAGGGRIVRLEANGAVAAQMQLGFVPSGIAVSPGSGRLWILDETNDVIRTYQ